MSVEEHSCTISYIYYVRIKPEENKQLLIRIGLNPLNKILTAFFTSLSTSNNFASPKRISKVEADKGLRDPSTQASNFLTH
jgi:hypothetical protein